MRHTRQARTRTGEASKVAESGSLGAPGSGGALARALRAGVPVSNRAAARLLQRQDSGYGYEFSDDPLNAGGFGPNDATIRVKPGPVRSTLIRPRTNARPPSDAAKPELEKLLSDFAAAKPDEKAAIAMQAVEAVIRAYGLSRRGLAGMSYDPKLTVYGAVTSSVGRQGAQQHDRLRAGHVHRRLGVARPHGLARARARAPRADRRP